MGFIVDVVLFDFADTFYVFSLVEFNEHVQSGYWGAPFFII